jgi:hypothetical protein
MCPYIEYGLQKSSEKRNNRCNIARRYHFNNTTAASTSYKRQLALESGMDLTLMRAITTKALTALFATIMWLSMILPSNLFAQTTEDDGYTYPDNSTPEEQHKQDKQEKQMWKDAGKPGDNDNNNNNDNNNGDSGLAQPPCSTVPEGDTDCYNDDNNDLPTCKNGVVQDCKVKGGITCMVEKRDDPCMDIWYGLTGGGWPECCDGRNDKDSKDNDNNDKPNPYCDKFASGAAPVGKNCHDRTDYSDTTGLYPCNDGTEKADYKDCKDVSGYNYNNDNNNNNDSPRTTPPAAHVVVPPRTTIDLQSCRYFGEQDAMNSSPMDYTISEM